MQKELVTFRRHRLREATGVWAKIGLLSFGGPAGQIAMMHRVFVDERKWLSEEEYLAALNFCMLLPGPEAMQLATYTGWKLHGWKGGLIAGLLFVLPGALVIWPCRSSMPRSASCRWSNALFFGIKAAVLAIVIEALLRVARRALKLAERLVDRRASPSWRSTSSMRLSRSSSPLPASSATCADASQHPGP